MSDIRLGDTVKDMVTGLQGVVIGRTRWLTACDTLIISPGLDKDGKKLDSEVIDITVAKLVKGKKRIVPEPAEAIAPPSVPPKKPPSGPSGG